MQPGIKIEISDWIKILDKMELGKGEQADSGITKLQDLLAKGYSIDHVLWDQSTDYEVGWFTFVLNKAGEAKQKCGVVYGPQSADLAYRGAFELYFRKRPNLERGVEEQYYSEMDTYWKAGL